MKKILSLAMLAGLSIAMFSCEEKKDSPIGYGDYPFSTKTDEEIRETLATTGVDLLKATEGIVEEKSYIALTAFGEFAEYLVEEEPVDIIETAPKARTMNVMSEDILELADLCAEYTYDAAKKSWSSEALEGKQAIFNFPSTSTGTENNAKIVIAYTETDYAFGDESYSLPQSATAEITVDNAKVGSISLAAEGVSADKLTGKANVNITLGSYVLKEEVSSASNGLAASASFKSGDKTLLSAEADLAVEVSWESIDEEDYSSMGEGNVSVSLNDDIAMVGYADASKIADIVEKYEALYDENEEVCEALVEEYWGDDGKVYADGEYNIEMAQEYYDKYDAWRQASTELENAEANEVAAQIKMVLVSRKDQKKLADVKLVSKWGYDDEYTDYYVEESIVFVFADGVEVEAETYFGEGFDTLIEAFEDFIKKFDL